MIFRGLERGMESEWAGVLLSLWFPGTTFIRAGHWTTGLAVLASFIALQISGTLVLLSERGRPDVAIALISLALLLWMGSIAHGVLRSLRRQQTERALPTRKDPFLAAILSQVFPGLGHFYVKAYGFGAVILVGWVTFWGFGIYLPWLVLDAAVALVIFDSFGRAGQTAHAKTALTVAVFSFIMMALLNAGRFAIWNAMAEPIQNVGDSMAPTICDGDIVLVDKRVEEVFRGDIIVFDGHPEFAGDRIIKRAVAFEGENVELKDGRIFVDEVEQSDTPFRTLILSDDSSGGSRSQRVVYPTPQNSLFVLGDNLPSSLDSRHVGGIAAARVEGVVSKIVWPPHRMKIIR